MTVLSDAPGWWERAQRRREFCAPDAPWLMAKEVGWPVRHANTQVRGDDDFLQGARECSAYLLATGLAPDAVYGIGVRAVWSDDPGRFSVVHLALPEVVALARAYQPTSLAPREPRIGHALVTGPPEQIIRRDKGQVQPTVGEAIALAIAFGRIEPERCYGAYQRSVPVLDLEHDQTVMGLGQGGLAITAPAGRPWAPQFAQGAPYRIEPGTVVLSPSGPIELARFGWHAFAERFRGGDASVPDSPLEVGVAFLETVGVQPRDCWGVFEGGAGARASVQIVYRKATDDAQGRARFARYLESVGVTVDDLDVGHPEGKIVFSRGRFRVTRH